MERFTRRSSDSNVGTDPATKFPSGNAHVKTVANPRKISFFWNPHFAVYFFGLHAINEKYEEVRLHFNNPPTTKKIVINHYPIKSREEYEKKIARGAADSVKNIYEEHPFEHIYNDEFDDKILKYENHRQLLRLENF